MSVSNNGKALASVTSTHYLGILINQYLTWKLHVANVLKWIRSQLYALYHLRPLPGHSLYGFYNGGEDRFSHMTFALNDDNIPVFFGLNLRNDTLARYF